MIVWNRLVVAAQDAGFAAAAAGRNDSKVNRFVPASVLCVSHVVHIYTPLPSSSSSASCCKPPIPHHQAKPFFFCLLCLE